MVTDRDAWYNNLPIHPVLAQKGVHKVPLKQRSSSSNPVPFKDHRAASLYDPVLHIGYPFTLPGQVRNLKHPFTTTALPTWLSYFRFSHSYHFLVFFLGSGSLLTNLLSLPTTDRIQTRIRPQPRPVTLPPMTKNLKIVINKPI